MVQLGGCTTNLGSDGRPVKRSAASTVVHSQPVAKSPGITVGPRTVPVGSRNDESIFDFPNRLRALRVLNPVHFGTKPVLVAHEFHVMIVREAGILI